MAICSPCLNCTERQVGCHSNCDEYLDFRHKVNEENKVREQVNFYEHGYRIEKKHKLDKIAKYRRSN